MLRKIAFVAQGIVDVVTSKACAIKIAKWSKNQIKLQKTMVVVQSSPLQTVADHVSAEPVIVVQLYKNQESKEKTKRHYYIVKKIASQKTTHLAQQVHFKEKFSDWNQLLL